MKTLTDQWLWHLAQTETAGSVLAIADRRADFMAGAAAMAELFATGDVQHRCEWTTTTGERCELWKNHGDAHAWQIHRGD